MVSAHRDSVESLLAGRITRETINANARSRDRHGGPSSPGNPSLRPERSRLLRIERPQLDLATCPEIIAAQHRAGRLLRRCTPQQLIFAQLAATRHITGQASRDTSASIRPAADWRRRARLLKDSNRHLDIPATRDELASAAIYPDAIALAVAALVPAPA